VPYANRAWVGGVPVITVPVIVALVQVIAAAGVGIAKSVLKKYNPRKHYAEHPYIKATVDGHVVELVPCYKISKGNKIISAVDRTPLHNEYVLKNLKEKHLNFTRGDLLCDK